MPTTQLAGLVSGFDWKSFIDKTIQYESAPITAIQNEQATNTNQINALNSLKDTLTALQSASTDLQSADVFSARTATAGSSTSGLTATAATGTATGTYAVAITQLATTSRLNGGSDIGSALSATGDVSGLTLSTLPTATAVTAGTFTVNGQQVTIALSDSLQDVFDKISTATGGNVTASYDPATDHISLSATSGSIILGAANDTSNFLTSAKLANNGTGTVASSAALGVIAHASPLASAHLKTAVTAVDGSGNGSFTINGVSISYNVNTDSLDSVISKINASTAGVSASYDVAGDKMILANTATGNTGISVSESAGGLLGSLGLTGGGATLSLGNDALYTINGGTTLSSKSNTLSADSHGITGLSVTATATGSDTITVAADTAGMKSKINAFITAYNNAQTAIDTQTSITTTDNKVTAAVLSNNQEVSSWASSLRSDVFSAVSGLTGTITQLDNLGIDFTSGTSQLAIQDSTKLDNALSTTPTDVAAFFTQSSTGFGARMQSFVDKVVGTDLITGYISQETTTLTSQNTDLDTQIANIQRGLDAERARLTASFVAMEDASQQQQSMQTQLTNAFPSTTKA